MTTTSTEGTLPIDRIKVQEGFNARQNDDDIDDLTGSMRLLGMISPLTVTEDGTLIAGHRRFAAAKKLGWEEVPVTIRRPEEIDPNATYLSGRPVEGIAAAENITRQQLAPAEEATAIQRMLDHGYTPEGAAQALGMPLNRVTRRLDLLRIPENLRVLWGPDGDAHLDIVPTIAALIEKVPELADSLLTYHQAGHSINGLTRNPAWWLRQIINAADRNSYQHIKGLKVPKDFVLASKGTQFRSSDVKGKAAQRFDELEAAAQRAGLYGGPRLDESDVDAARAAGVTLDLNDGDDQATYVYSMSWLRARVASDILPRYEQQIENAKAASARAKGRTPKAKPGEPAIELTPQEQEQKDRGTREREAQKRWQGLAGGANLDLGAALLNGISTVELTVDVARFFAEASLGERPPKKETSYDRPGDRPAPRLAAAGMRYVMPGWRTETLTPTKSNPDKIKVEYLPIEEAERKLWAWFDQAKQPGEILGRALMIHAAARYAVENVLPRTGRIMGDHQKTYCYRYVVQSKAAEKALEKIVRPHLPASVKKLIKEITSFDADQAVGGSA